MASILKFENVSKKFNHFAEHSSSFLDLFVQREDKYHHDSAEFWIVRNFSLDIQSAESVGIIGDNGAGKSTILKMGARIIEPTSGRVILNGKVGALLEVGVGFHPDLTGRENIFLSGAVIGMRRDEMRARFDDIVEFSGVGDFIDMPVRHYSSGMLVRLGFSVATSVEPDILLVDEVLSVGDYAFRDKCLARIASLQNRGTAILYVSHNLEEVRRICDRVIWLRDAQVVCEGQPDEIVRAYINYTLRERGIEVWHLGDDAERGRRLGIGGMEILDCVLLDHQGKPTHTLSSGERFLLRIDYRTDKMLEAVVFGVSVYNKDNIRVLSPDSHVYHEVPPQKSASIYLVIEDFPLKSGHYDLTVAASDPRSSEYAPYVHHHRTYTFEILKGEGVQDGLVKVLHRWIRTSDWEQVRAALKKVNHA